MPSPFGLPHPAARRAAQDLQQRLPVLREGKMFGVLVVDGGYLAAFSGMLDGHWVVPGFVPPAFDLAAKIASADPSNPAARLALAVQDVASGKNDDALAVLDHAGSADLAKLTSGLASAWIEFGQGKVDDALTRIAALKGPDWYPVFTDLHAALMQGLNLRKARIC